MRLLPIFLIIIFLSGFLIFSYIAWITFRGREDLITSLGGLSIRGLNGKPPGPNEPYMGDGDQIYPSNVNNPMLFKPKNSKNPEDKDEFEGLSAVDEDKLMGADVNKAIQNLKMRVISKLRRHLLNGAKVKGKAVKLP